VAKERAELVKEREDRKAEVAKEREDRKDERDRLEDRQRIPSLLMTRAINSLFPALYLYPLNDTWHSKHIFLTNQHTKMGGELAQRPHQGKGNVSLIQKCSVDSMQRSRRKAARLVIIAFRPPFLCQPSP
jgi:hypothetical protein